MKRSVLLISIVLISLSSVNLSADDGSWSKSFTISGGSIYSETDNPDVVMEKELLIFDGKSTRVHFLFRNTSDRRVTVTCGFPVVHNIQSYYFNDYLEIPESPYGSVKIPGIGFFETIQHPNYSEDEPFFSYPEVITLSEFNNSRSFIDPSEASRAGIEFYIEQDSSPVDIGQVLIERKADKEGAVLTFHFKHDLVFEPGTLSTVEVRYSQDLLFGNEGSIMDNFRWSYVIGTGGTWKGPIGEFFFIKPAAWKGEVSGMKAVSSEENPVNIYYAENYEPERETEFSLRWAPMGMMESYMFFDSLPEKKSMWIERTGRIPIPEDPAQDFVKDISASSALGDRVDVLANEGVIMGAGFGPEAAFDGIPETAWCENAADYGEGEYLQVSFDEHITGLVIRNGFKRFPFDDWVFERDTFDKKIKNDDARLRDYFTMNSRVKTLTIMTDEGRNAADIILEDRRDPQTIYGLDLQPGTYKFVIREVYPGSRWKDTCLGEITFIPVNAAQKLHTDSFFRDTLGIVRF